MNDAEFAQAYTDHTDAVISTLEQKREADSLLDRPELQTMALCVISFVHTDLLLSLGYPLNKHVFPNAFFRIVERIQKEDYVLQANFLCPDTIIVAVKANTVFDAHQKASKLHVCFESVPLDGLLGQQTFQVRIGVAMSNFDGEMNDSIYEGLMQATFAAKSSQHERTSVFNPMLLEKAKFNNGLVEDLTKLFNNPKRMEAELTLFMMPIHDLNTGKIASYELLIRWIHPKHGIINPGDFLFLVYLTQNMRKLTMFVIHRAIAMKKELLRRTRNQPFHINICPKTMWGSFADQFLEAINESDLGPDAICLELLESGALANKRHIEQFHRLKQMGYCIAIDDFLANNSFGVAHLKDLRCAMVKLDMCVARELEQWGPILKNIVLFINSFLAKTTAEGIENIEDMQEFKRFGVDFGQGYLFSKPKTAREMLP